MFITFNGDNMFITVDNGTLARLKEKAHTIRLQEE